MNRYLNRKPHSAGLDVTKESFSIHTFYATSNKLHFPICTSWATAAVRLRNFFSCRVGFFLCFFFFLFLLLSSSHFPFLHDGFICCNQNKLLNVDANNFSCKMFTAICFVHHFFNKIHFLIYPC